MAHDGIHDTRPLTSANILTRWTNGVALSVANIDDPSAELNAIAGGQKGELRICYQEGAGTDSFTVYAWDDASTTAEDVPRTVDGSSGTWVAIGGEYIAGFNVNTHTHTLSDITDSGAAAALGATGADANAVSGTAGTAGNMSQWNGDGDLVDMTKAQALAFLNVEDGADVTDAANVDAAGATMNTDTDVSTYGYVLDEDDMASDDATKVPTQQSVRAFVDGKLSPMRYLFSTNTADADPGAGTLRWDNATPASVGKIYIDDVPDNLSSTDTGGIWNNASSSRLLMAQQNDASKFLLAEINSTVDSTGYWQLNVTVEDSGTLPDNGAALSLHFYGAPQAGGGSDVVLDLGDDGTNESAALGEIATTGDTNSIFTEPSADKLLIDVGQNWPTADVANALATNALDAIGEIDASVRSGLDATLITGTAGTAGNLAEWNSDGDVIDGPNVLDEDDMASDSAAAVATQQSIAAFVNGRHPVIDYIFSATTTDADPGAGTLRANSATPASVTQFFVDDAPDNVPNVDLGTVWDASAGSRLLIVQKNDASKFWLAEVTADADGTGYWKLTVTIDDSGTLPDDGAGLSVIIIGGGTTAASAPAYFINRLINDSFAIRQRYDTTATGVADATYIFDRWINLTDASGNMSVDRVGGNVTRFACELQHSVASTLQYLGAFQKIEGKNCRDLRGDDVAFSATVDANAGIDVYYAILEWTGTEDAADDDPVSSWGTDSTITFKANWSKVASGSSSTSGVHKLSDITATLGTSFTNLAVLVWWQETDSAPMTVEAPQLVRGSSTPDYQPRDVATEVALCQRYFRKSYDIDTAPGTVVDSHINHVKNSLISSVTDFIIEFTPMRAPGTVTLYSPVTGSSGVIRNFNPSADANATAGGANGRISDSGFNITTTNGQGADNHLAAHYTVDSEI